MLEKVNIHGYEIPLRWEAKPNEKVVPLSVSDVNDEKEIKQTITTELTRRNWWLGLNFQGAQVRECRRIAFALRNGASYRHVDVFNFMSYCLTSADWRRLVDALTTFWVALNDKRFFHLKTIQIMPKNELNPKSGESFRGREYPAQERFELFSASFEPGHYRKQIECSWLQGSCWHEATHVCLERILEKQWKEADLGWRETPKNIRVQLPGGGIRSLVQIQPERCVSTYATFQPDDDRAETVVGWLAKVKLDPVRAQMVGRVLSLGEKPIIPHVRLLNPRLPEANIPVFKIVQADDDFSPVGISGDATAPTILTLDQFRASLAS